MGKSVIKRLYKKYFGRPSDDGPAHSKKIVFPPDFFTRSEIPPRDNLISLGMTEIFRFTNNYYAEHRGKPRTISVGHKEDKIYMAVVEPETPERLRGVFVMESETLDLFCNKLEGLLGNEWDDSWGKNMIYNEKDRILMSLCGRNVSGIDFKNHRYTSLDGSRSYDLDHAVTYSEAKLLLEELRKYGKSIENRSEAVAQSA